VFPNLQFWDYVKRGIDDEIGAAVRAGQNNKVRNLSNIVRRLRATLDKEVPGYQQARNAWSGPAQYREAIEEGEQILNRTLSGEQLRANLATMEDVNRQGYVLGAVSAIIDKLSGDPAKLADLTKHLRSPAMREKIAAIMPNPQAAEEWFRRY